MSGPTETGGTPPPEPENEGEPENEFAALQAREEFFTATLQRTQRTVNLAEAVRLQVMLAGFEAMLLEEQAQTGLIPRPDDPVVTGFYLHQAHELLTTRHDIARRLDAARTLRDRLPKTWAVFLAGEASERNVVKAAEQVNGLTADDEFATYDSAAAVLVATERPTVVERKLADLRDSLNPAATLERHKVATNRRHVRARAEGDGQGVLEIHGPATDIAAAYDRIRKHAVVAHGRDGECRTLGNLMADLAIDAILTGSMRGRSDGGPSFPLERLGEGDDPTRKVIDATVMVVVSAETATRTGDQPAEVAGMGLIDAQLARSIVAHTTTWTRVLVDPIDDTVLGIDSRERYIPAGLKKLLQFRQRTCGCGCGLPAFRADIDHIVRYEHDGRTRHDNLQILCRASHLAKDAGHADVTMQPDGTIRWHDKWGGVKRVTPDVKIRTTTPPSTTWPDEVPF